MADVPPPFRRPPNLDWVPQIEEPPRRPTFNPALYATATVDVPPPLPPPVPPVSLSFLVTLDEGADGELIKLIAPVWHVLLAEIAKDPELLLRMTDRKFEELVAATYDADGADDVILTPRSGDLGRDVIAVYRSRGRVRILDQAKQFALGRLVPAKDVRELMGVLALDANASKGVLTTTSDFAPGVAAEFESAIPYRIELVNGTQLQARLAQLAKK